MTPETIIESILNNHEDQRAAEAVRKAQEAFGTEAMLEAGKVMQELQRLRDGLSEDASMCLAYFLMEVVLETVKGEGE